MKKCKSLGLIGLVVTLFIFSLNVRADIYEGWVVKRISNSDWILQVGGAKFYVEMSMCLSLALPTEDVIIKSDDSTLGPGDTVIFVDDGGEECWVRSAAQMSQ